jgi:hypothetical protein
MASGISSPWGESLQNVTGLRPSLNYGDTHLTGELSLTSIPPTFSKNDGSMISPLTVKQKSYYVAFGKRKSNFLLKLRIISKEINYLKN